MNLLVSVVTVALAISFAICASLPKLPERKDNVIVLEVASTGDDGPKRVRLDSDKLLREGKNFSSLQDMINVLDEDRKSKSEDEDEDSFSIVVPVARNFSSLKELFEILREDDMHHKGQGNTGQTHVKGTEANSSEYMIFFTS